MNGAFVLCFTLLAGIVCVTICRVDKQEFETRMDGVHSRHDGNFQRRLKTPHCRRRSVCVDCNEEENKMCKTGECAETCPNRTGDSVNKCCNGNSCGDKEYCDIDDAVWGVIFAIVGAAACICICVCGRTRKGNCRMLLASSKSRPRHHRRLHHQQVRRRDQAVQQQRQQPPPRAPPFR